MKNPLYRSLMEEFFPTAFDIHSLASDVGRIAPPVNSGTEPPNLRTHLDAADAHPSSQSANAGSRPPTSEDSRGMPIDPSTPCPLPNEPEELMGQTAILPLSMGHKRRDTDTGRDDSPSVRRNPKRPRFEARGIAAELETTESEGGMQLTSHQSPPDSAAGNDDHDYSSSEEQPSSLKKRKRKCNDHEFMEEHEDEEYEVIAIGGYKSVKVTHIILDTSDERLRR